MSREAVQRVVVYTCALLLAIASIVRYVQRRPPYFAAPETLVDHVGPVEHETREALIVIPQAEPLLPRGAEVTAFRPKNGQTWDDNGIYLAAVGLLPHHSVLPPWSLPEYVIAVGKPFENDSYTRVASFAHGALYKRR